MTTPALSLRGLNAWYGESHALQGVDLDVQPGEAVALLGRNGSGRTTTLRAVMGLCQRRSGSIRIAGREALALKPHEIARLGVGYCPEERGIYGTLSCEENLRLPPVVSAGGMEMEEIYELFPNLWERRASPGLLLSGGEQQMLAIARILRTGARLLLLDEISEGLAPAIVKTLDRVVRQLKKRQYTIVLVEQNFHFAAGLSDRYYVLEHGKVAMQGGTHAALRDDPVLQSYLGV